MKKYRIGYSKYLKTLGYSLASQKVMLYGMEEFLGKQSKSPDRISRAEIELYAEYLSNRPNRRRGGGLSSSMLRCYLYGLKVFFSWLEKTGQIVGNPMSGFTLPEVEQRARLILKKSEVLTLYDVCETYADRAMLSLFYGCGLRRNEGEKLNAADIHFRSSVLYVRKGKGGKRRAIPLSNQVRKDLLNYYKKERGRVSDQEAFMFNSSGRRMTGNSYNARLKKLLSKAGLAAEISLHSLRHSIATHLLAGGLSLEQVRDFLGHGHLESTQIYTHYEFERLSKYTL